MAALPPGYLSVQRISGNVTISGGTIDANISNENGPIDVNIVSNEVPQITPQKITYCDETTNTHFEKVCIFTQDPTGNVVETILSGPTDTGIPCSETTPNDSEFSQVEMCVNGTVQIQLYQIDVIDGVTQPMVAIGVPINTGIACGKQTVDVDTCDGTESVEVDTVVSVKGVQTVKICPCPEQPFIGLITDLSMLNGPVTEDDEPQNSNDPNFIVQPSGDQTLPPSGVNIPLFVGYENNTDDGFNSVQIAFETDATNPLTLTPTPVMFGDVGAASASFGQTIIAHNEPSGAVFTITWILTGIRLGETFEDRVTNVFTVA